MSTKDSPEALARRASKRRAGGGGREPEGRRTQRGVLFVHDLGFTVLLDEERIRQDGHLRARLEGQGLRLVLEADSDEG